MSTANKTPNLSLPQYTGSDKFDLEEINKGYLDIDSAYKEIIDFREEIPKVNASAEVIEARDGEETLYDKIKKIDTNIVNNTASLDSNTNTLNSIINSNNMLDVGVNLGGRDISVFNIDLIKRLKVTHFRIELTWWKIEKTKGVYDFSLYDSVIMQLINNNIQPVFVLGLDNNLYTTKRAIETTEERTAYINYVLEVVKRYGQYSVKYEIWNEPNHPTFWVNQSTAPYYYTLLVKETFKAIRGIDTKNKIVACSLANGYRPEESAYRVSPFFFECCKNGILDYLDVVSIHPYSIQKPEDLGVVYNAYKNAINHYTKRSIQIDVNEFGYAITPNWDGMSIKPLPSLSDDERGNYIIRTLLVNLMHGVTSSTIFEFYSPQTNTTDSEFWLSLYDKNYNPYGSTEKLKGFMDKLGINSELITFDNPTTSDYLLLFKKSNGSYVLVYWTTRNNHTVTYNNVVFSMSTEPQIKDVDSKDFIQTNIDYLKNNPQYDGSIEYALSLPGKKAINNGEIFSDYEYNFADYYGTVFGRMNVAYASNLYNATYIDKNNLQLDKVTGLSVGNVVLVKESWANFRKVTITNIDTNTNTVTFKENVYSNSKYLLYRPNEFNPVASFSEGANNTSVGYGSHTEGVGCLAIEQGSHAEGTGTQATGLYGHAEGLNTKASGSQSHAEGNGSIASGSSSHAEGNSQATASLSHAQNTNTVASGHSSHSEGNATIASANNSHAQGYNTKASGVNSHSSGDSTEASGMNSATFNEGTKATNRSQTAVGKYNSPRNDTVFEVGTGTTATRKTGFMVFDGSSNFGLQSSDGTIWRITIDNNGILTSTKV